MGAQLVKETSIESVFHSKQILSKCPVQQCNTRDNARLREWKKRSDHYYISDEQIPDSICFDIVIRYGAID